MSISRTSGASLTDVSRVLPGLLDLAGSVAPRTLEEYRRDAAYYLYYCEDAKILPLNANSLWSWRAQMVADTQLSPNTINRRLAAIKSIVRSSERLGAISKDEAAVFVLVEDVKVAALRQRTKVLLRFRLFPQDIRALLELPDRETLIGLRDYAILHVFASSGCRISEVSKISISDIVETAEGYLVSVLGKGQEESRLAPLGRDAFLAIKNWVEARNPAVSPSGLFTAFSAPGAKARPLARVLSDRQMRRIVVKYATRLGKPIRPHDFRRFVGTELARANPRNAQLALGHKNLETTARSYMMYDLEAGLTDNLY